MSINLETFLNILYNNPLTLLLIIFFGLKFNSLISSLDERHVSY